MKLALLAVCFIFSTSALAWDNEYLNDTPKKNEGYRSSYGNEYKYDMSKREDRQKYSTDYNAQIRDSYDVNPYKDLERGLGEYGAGRKR